jgi:hypothetical protein
VPRASIPSWRCETNECRFAAAHGLCGAGTTKEDDVTRLIATVIALIAALGTVAPPSMEIHTSGTYVKSNGIWRWVLAQSTPVAAAR